MLHVHLLLVLGVTALGVCRFDTVSARLDSQVEKADTEGAELRGKLAVVQQDLQAARLALAESTQEERADRAEAELEKAKEKAKTAEAAAATVRPSLQAASFVLQAYCPSRTWPLRPRISRAGFPVQRSSHQRMWHTCARA